MKTLVSPINRRQFLTRSMVYLIATGTAVTWGYEEPKHVKLEYHQITTNKLANRIRIIQISDLHLDSNRSRDYVPKMINNCEADLILMTGDYTNNTIEIPVQMERVDEYINQLKSKLGIYAVFGNWDIGIENRLFTNTNVKTLDSKSINIKNNNDLLAVVGAGYIDETNAVDLASKIKSNGYNIMLTHTPDMTDVISDENSIDLHLCGHTHGGQIRIPFLRLFQDGKGEFPYAGGIIPKSISKNGSKYQSGMYQVKNMKSYVNRGLGTSAIQSLPQIRILCQPEVTLFDIGPKDKLPKVKNTPWYNS